jgi:hypothetical protein
MSIKAMNADILWHRKNPGGSGCGDSFESGFICGLKQARRLARKVLNSSGINVFNQKGE